MVKKSNAKKQGCVKYVFLALYILCAATTVFTSCRAGAASANDSSVFTSIISAVKPLKNLGERYGDFEGLLRKLCGHYALFTLTGVFCALTVYFFKKNIPLAIYITFFSGAFLGGVNETIQYFVPLRNGSVTDVILDAHGYFIGGAITLTIIALNKNDGAKNEFSSIIVCALLTIAIDLFYIFGGEKTRNVTAAIVVGNAVFAAVLLAAVITLLIKQRKNKNRQTIDKT